jgi:glycosyltransferase involved in cell wall biosynthesis
MQRLSRPTCKSDKGGKMLVSCLMPTYNRRAFVPQAIACFLRQDYLDRELIVIDDGDDWVKDLIPSDLRIRYLHFPKKWNLGDKRNLCCSIAEGEVLMHWDDDDWHSPHRISAQMAPILSGEAPVTGTSTTYFYDPRTREAFRYTYPDPGQYIIGATLAFRQSVWKQYPFPPKHLGEDTTWMNQVRAAGVVMKDLVDPTLCVASIHGSNTAPRKPEGGPWNPASRGIVEWLIADSTGEPEPDAGEEEPTP